MSNLSDYAEAHLLNYLLTTQTGLTRPTAWWAALHTGNPGEAGTVGEMGTASGYARQTCTFATAASGAGTTDNANALTFGPATVSNWGTISGISIWDAATGGNCLFQGLLATARAIVTGDSATFAVGALDITLA